MSSLNVGTTCHIYYFTFKLYFFVIHFFVTLTKLQILSRETNRRKQETVGNGWRCDITIRSLSFHNTASEHVFIPEINPHCILSQIYALFIEFYYEYVHLIPHSGPTKSGNEKHRLSLFSEYRTYVSLYYNAYL
jgi:hypothetical protein